MGALNTVSVVCNVIACSTSVLAGRSQGLLTAASRQILVELVATIFAQMADLPPPLPPPPPAEQPASSPPPAAEDVSRAGAGADIATPRSVDTTRTGLLAPNWGDQLEGGRGQLCHPHSMETPHTGLPAPSGADLAWKKERANVQGKGGLGK